MVFSAHSSLARDKKIKCLQCWSNLKQWGGRGINIFQISLFHYGYWFILENLLDFNILYFFLEKSKKMTKYFKKLIL